MNEFVRRYQPARYESWSKGLDLAPHPEEDIEHVPASLSITELEFSNQHSSASSDSIPGVHATSFSLASLHPPIQTSSWTYSENRQTVIQDQHRRSMISTSKSLRESAAEPAPVSLQARTDTSSRNLHSSSPLLQAAQLLSALAPCTSVDFSEASALHELAATDMRTSCTDM